MRFYSRLAMLCCLGVLCAGCALLKDSKDQYLVCPYDAVWNAAVDTMKAFPVKVRDKEKGLIETGWTEMEASERRFGFFRRAAFDNKERARMVLTVKQLDEVTELSLTENRERWHVRGGVTSQATRWWPVEPSEEAMTSVVNLINTKLKGKGCSLS